MTSDDQDPRSPAAVGDGQFQIVRRLGSGGMGVVYLARDTVLQRTVAVKVIRADLARDPSLRAAFVREARLAARLEHPGIVPVFGFGQDDGVGYLVMRYLPFETLGERLRREGRLPEETAVDLLAQLASTLAYAHGEGVVHRDIKPDNIFLETHGERVRPILTDFGIAHRPMADPGPGQRRLSIGTPHYMSPEQAMGELDLDGRSDQFALGVLGYQMLTGSVPYDGTSERAIAAARVQSRREAIAGDLASSAVVAIIDRCLAVEPVDRFARASDLASALTAVAGRPHSRAPRRWRWRRRTAAPAPLAPVTVLNGPALAHPRRQVTMHRVLSDVRYALRSLRQAPTVALAAIVCIALGIGATTAIFGAVNRALLKPLPFRDPGRLVSVFRTTPHFRHGPFSAPNLVDLTAATKTLSSLAAIAPGTGLLGRPDGGLTVGAHRVTANWFATLGVEPMLGRLFTASDADLGEPAVAVVTEEFWREHLGADSAVVGRSIRLDGAPVTVVGVVRSGFRVPTGGQLFRSDLWLPLRFTDRELSARRNNNLVALGRLAPGISLDAAQSEFTNLMAGLVRAHPELAGEGIEVLPLHREATRALRGPLLLLLGAVGLVLLIAAANVASLLLARNVERERELAVRTALGAASPDLLRRIMVESGLVVAVGTLLGLALAWLGTRLIGALAAARLPQLAGLSIEPRVVVVATGLAILTAAVCGWAPARRAVRLDPQIVLRAGGRGGRGLDQLRFLGVIAAGQVALSVTLLIGTGLVTRGFLSLIERPAGFDPSHLLTLTATVEGGNGGGTVARFAEPALEAIRRVNGVRAAGIINLVPYDNWGNNSNVLYEGREETDPTRLPLVEFRLVSPGYFATFGLAPVKGRLFEPADLLPDRPLVVVANQALVDRDFPRQDPIGKRFRVTDTSFATIVGVVPDVRNAGPIDRPSPEFYWPIARVDQDAVTFPIVIRTEGDPVAVSGAVVAAIRAVDPRVAIGRIRRMTEVIGAAVGTPRFYLILLSAFSAVALIMTVAGLYGVMSYGVALRRREIGIRAALGSTALRTVVAVGRQGGVLVVTGLIVGLIAAGLVTRLLRALLYGVDPLDPMTWLIVVAALLAAAFLAIVIPARRATAVDPLESIRAD